VTAGRSAATRVVTAIGCALISTEVPALAGTWGEQSSVALTTLYSSNPFYLVSEAQGAGSTGLVLNLPISYTGDASTFDFIPRVRFAESFGPAQVLPDYEYLDTDWKLNEQRDSFKVSGTWHRDSTLEHPFESAALHGIDVYRIEASGEAQWQHALTERDNMGVAASYTQTWYDAAAGGALSEYRYGQISGQYSRNLSELWQGLLSLGVGRYELPNVGNITNSRFAQAGVSGALTQYWTVSAQAGYSSEQSEEQALEVVALETPFGIEYFGIPVKVDTSGGTPTYSASAERHWEYFTLNLTGARAVLPTGFGALYVQQSFGVYGQYTLSERATLTLTVHSSQLTSSLQPQQSGGTRQFNGIDLGYSRQLAPQWSLTSQLSYDQQKYGQDRPTAFAATLTIQRQFGRIGFE
jgi:hypothetical protein